jgi:hypothetical protein
MDYDKAQDDSDEAYSTFVEWLENKTAYELQQAKGKKKVMKAAIAAYLEKGYSAHLTIGELRDFFAYSTPCILDKAGYSEKEIDMACEIYDEINPDCFARYYLEN